VARRIANLRADLATQTRVNEVADKANEGYLADAERAECFGGGHLMTLSLDDCGGAPLD